VPEVAKLPFHDGRAAVITPGGSQVRFEVPAGAKLPAESFTLEGFVLLRSVYEDGSIRPIAAHWDGEAKGAGWAFGVTGSV